MFTKLDITATVSTLFIVCQLIVTFISCYGQQIDVFTSPDIVHYSQILVEPSQDHLIVGARDTIIRINTTYFNITPDDIINWPANSEAIAACRMKGQSDLLCRNYVKVLLGKIADKDTGVGSSSPVADVFVCGTNAFRPVCTWRKADSLGTVESEEEASGKCPYNPSWNTTSLFTNKGVYFYFGPMDSQGHDNAVLRSKPSKATTKWARTIAADTRFINHDASFITSFEKDDYVYFLFRESAVEYMNCGKTIYSRIGRICTNDKGERRSSGRYLTTFVKARINCSYPGQFPFYFDEIQSAFYSNGTVYGVFSTPGNSIHGSAICTFTMDSVEDAFEGPFKHQDTPGSMYKPEYNKDIASQFSCSPNSIRMDQIRNQAKYQLMDRSVGSTGGRPLLIERTRLTKITVDTISTKTYPEVKVLFVLTSEARLRRYVTWPGKSKACFISEWDLGLPANDSVLTMTLVQTKHSIYIGTVKSLRKIGMSDCGRYKTETLCLASNDPYCAWNRDGKVCDRFPNSLETSLESWNQMEDVDCSERPKGSDWSPWSDWRTCQRLINSTNDDNKTNSCLCRSRQCLALGCNELDDIEVTNCTIDGGWTAWSPWTPCSVSCGINGTKTRSRSCTNPSPQFGGLNCVGAGYEKIQCLDNPPCLTLTTTTTTTTTVSPSTDLSIENDGWSQFGDWEECPVKCGGGVQVRRRVCLDETGNGARCRGCDMEWRLCNTEPCKEVRRTYETRWYQVNYTLDGEAAVEERLKFSCKAYNLAEETDLALNVRREERTRSLGWSECSVKCGKGFQFMFNGRIYLKRVCDTGINCVGWSTWSKWSPCVNGERARVRSCKKEKCEGSEEERLPCTSNGLGKTTINSVSDDNNLNEPDNDLAIEIKGEEASLRLGGFISSSSSSSSSPSSSTVLDEDRDADRYIHHGWSTSNLILFSCIGFIVGTLIGSLITYLIIRRKLIDGDNSKLSLKLFASSHNHDKTSNPYVTADHFRITNNLTNSPNSASTCLLNGVGCPPSLTSSSSPMLAYSPIREATVKRASTIRAKLNSDQNF